MVLNAGSKIAISVFFGVAAVCARVQAGPTNDLFAARTVLTGTNVTVGGSNGGAGNEPGEDTGSGNARWFYSVWYSWTAPTNGVLHLSASTAAPNFFPSVRTYRGTAVDALTLATYLPDGGIPVTPGDTVAIQVASIYYPAWGGGGGTGPFTLTLALEVPAPTSANDAFANRFSLSVPTSHFEGSIYGASSEPGEPLPAPNAQQTLWWTFVPPVNGVLNLALSTPQFTPWLTVYDGSQFSSMTPVAPLNGTIYSLQGGHEYSIQMATGYVPGGAFTLDTRFQSSSNDMWAGSDQLSGTNLTYYGNFTAATFEPGEPASPATNTVWVAWAAPCTGRVSYSLATAPQFQYCQVFTGPTLALLQPVPTVGMGNRLYGFLARQDTVYYFQFSGGANNFTFSLSVNPLLPASNDNLADAQVIKGKNTDFDPKSVLGATMEPGEPNHMGPVPQKSLWWKWQAPNWGTCYMSAQSSLVPNVVLAAYTGESVAALSLVGKGTNTLQCTVEGGQTYYIAGAVDADALGDIAGYSQIGRVDNGTHLVPGNLLQEPSWEGTHVLDAHYWHWSGGLGGYINERGGVDGTTWPSLSTGTTLWQDFPTVPGHVYRLRFAYLVGGNNSSCCGDAHVSVSWDTNPLGVSDIPAGESGYWHWSDYLATASNTTTRVTFQNLARNVEMDAFSVVDMSAPPVIATQPSSASTVSAGTAAFVVGATGAPPLAYQWFFNNAPLAGQTNGLLVLSPANTNQIGTYFATVTNAFGAVTSAVVSLYVDAPAWPTIVWQPYGDTVPVGGEYQFYAVAIGTPPLDYQWYFQGSPLPGATTQTWALTNVQPTDAGSYQVTVHNAAGKVWSLPATLSIGQTNQGGGLVAFQNFRPGGFMNLDAPVFDIDGVTRLNGGSFQAQLYAGPSLEWLRPVGQPTSFRTGFSAGYVVPETITLANVPPGGSFVAQVRAWDGAVAGTYEAARALGGKFGKSGVLSLTAGGEALPTTWLEGLKSFSLQAGLPQFTVGEVRFVERQPRNVLVWAVNGAPGSRYLVEKAGRNLVFQPYTVLTNVTGTVTFTDTANSGSAATFYRARILD